MSKIRKIAPDELLMPGDFTVQIWELPILEILASSKNHKCSDVSVGYTGQEASQQWANNLFYTTRKEKYRVMSDHEIVLEGIFCTPQKQKGLTVNVSKVTSHHWGRSVGELKADYPYYHFLSLEESRLDPVIFNEPFGLIRDLSNDYCLPK